jgi:hypothetical protein
LKRDSRGLYAPSSGGRVLGVHGCGSFHSHRWRGRGSPRAGTPDRASCATGHADGTPRWRRARRQCADCARAVPSPLPLDSAPPAASPSDSSRPSTSPPIADSTSPPARDSAPRLVSTPARSSRPSPPATSFEVISLGGTFLFRSRGDIISSRQQRRTNYDSRGLIITLPASSHCSLQFVRGLVPASQSNPSHIRTR